VGALKMKLFEYDDGSEGARERRAAPTSSWSTGKKRESSWNGEKFLGGEVASHDCPPGPNNVFLD
jgi:hypothetical protein